MSISKYLLSISILMLTAGVAVADRAADEKAIRETLKTPLLTSVEPTAIPGLYEAVVGPKVVYMSADGRYMLQGDLIDVKEKKNITQSARFGAQLSMMNRVEKKDMIIFEAEKKKHYINVFTDIDCAYCRKLHSELDLYLERGIEVRYLMYPRAGKRSVSFKKAVAVLCAEDRNKALTLAKADGKIEMKTCESPIDKHMGLANVLDLTGTPLIVTDYGQILAGYIPAKKLSKYLEKHGSN